MKTNGSMKFKVKHDPLPPSNGGGVKKYDWPFEKMKVGECFYFPIEGAGFKAIYAARHTIMRAAKEWRVTGRRFATRLMPGDKEIGVWRIA